MYSEVTKCILCSGESLTQVIDLGMQYVVDFPKEKNEKLLKAPLVLNKCNSCHLIQLKHRVSPDRLYKKFWYRSGINEQMKDELLAIVQHAERTVDLQPGDKVLDIGCNDGTLLGCYTNKTFTVGIDPCKELVDEGVKAKKIDMSIADYFSADIIRSTFNSLGVKYNNFPKFKIITAVAMFYDTTNPVEFLKDCGRLLDKEGVLVIQMNYLVDMLRDNAFDFICHEHSALYSVSTLTKAVELAGLEFEGLELSKSNGGSLRAYITHKQNTQFSIKDTRDKLWLNTNHSMKLMEEMRIGLDKLTPYTQFSSAIASQMVRLKNYLIDTVAKGNNKIYVAGASTRGTVLLQYLYQLSGWLQDNCPTPLLGVADRDEHKHGLRMVGTWLPIMSEVEVRKEATHMLCLPWHFKTSITKREEDWISNGGTLIFPLPKLEKVTKSTNVEMFTHTEAV